MLDNLVSAFDREAHRSLTDEQKINLRSCMIWNACRDGEGEAFVEGFVSGYKQFGANDVWVDDLIDFFRESPELGLLTVLEVKSLKPLPEDFPDYDRLDALHHGMEQSLLGFIQDSKPLDNRLRLAAALQHYHCKPEVGSQARRIYNEEMIVKTKVSSFVPTSRRPF